MTDNTSAEAVQQALIRIECTFDGNAHDCRLIKQHIKALEAKVEALEAAAQPQAVTVKPLKFSELKNLWRKHGGDQHGPRVETLTIPEANFMAFMTEAITRSVADVRKEAFEEAVDRWLSADGTNTEDVVAGIMAALAEQETDT